MRPAQGLALGAALAASVLAAAGCGTGGLARSKGDVSHGKDLFQKTCGACHTLADAGTTGTVGPNLDDAFAGPRAQGFEESTIRSIVHDQILFPVSNPAGTITSPDGTVQRAPGMPAKLLTGSDAQDAAAYVASVAGLAASATTGATTTAPAPPPATTAAQTTSAAQPTTAAQTTTGGGPADLVAQGKQVFQTAGCTNCHTLADAGASGTIGPSLDEKKPPKSLVIDRVTNGKNVMPSFKSQLTEAEIDAVATYVSTVAGK